MNILNVSKFKKLSIMLVRTLLIFAFGVLLIGGVAKESRQEKEGTQEKALIGGLPTFDRLEVGQVAFSGLSTCTATLISERCFITAAHCVNFQPLFRGGGTFTIKRNASNSLVRMVDCVFCQGGGEGWDDIAIGRLTQPVPPSWANPAAISAIQPTTGDTLTIIGYGCTDRDSKAGVNVKRFITYVHMGSTEHGCRGDSGGPVFLYGINDNGPIIRIHSGLRTGIFSTDIGADTVRLRTHILGLVRALEEDGISYRVHVQGEGWMPAVCTGEIAGTVGRSLRIEAIQIWSNRPGVSIQYRGHIQDNEGWTKWISDGVILGTTGKFKRLEAVQIRLASRSPRNEKLYYQAHVEGVGWQSLVDEGNMAGTMGKGRRMEAISIWIY